MREISVCVREGGRWKTIARKRLGYRQTWGIFFDHVAPTVLGHVRLLRFFQGWFCDRRFSRRARPKGGIRRAKVEDRTTDTKHATPKPETPTDRQCRGLPSLKTLFYRGERLEFSGFAGGNEFSRHGGNTGSGGNILRICPALPGGADADQTLRSTPLKEVISCFH